MSNDKPRPPRKRQPSPAKRSAVKFAPDHDEQWRLVNRLITQNTGGPLAIG